MLCRCGSDAIWYVHGLPFCLGCTQALLIEETFAILERAALDIEGFRAPTKLVMQQNDPAGTWSYEGPTYTLEGQG
jgi:hypothetical protein